MNTFFAVRICAGIGATGVVCLFCAFANGTQNNVNSIASDVPATAAFHWFFMGSPVFLPAPKPRSPAPVVRMAASRRSVFRLGLCSWCQANHVRLLLIGRASVMPAFHPPPATSCDERISLHHGRPESHILSPSTSLALRISLDFCREMFYTKCIP